MPSKRLLVTQTGVDVLTFVGLDTNLTIDGRTGWSIEGISAYWVDGETVPAADWRMDAVVFSDNVTHTFVDDEWIASVSWAAQNTGGVAVALPLEPYKQRILIEPRVTVQPIIYVGVKSSLTGIANDVIIQVNYSLIKLTDLEVLRLLQGGV